jgi:hypothetical protein
LRVDFAGLSDSFPRNIGQSSRLYHGPF